MSQSSETSRYCNHCKCQVSLEKFSKKKNGSTYFKQCDRHHQQNCLQKRRNYCIKKLEDITEEDAIRKPESLNSLIYMIQEVRFHFGDRMKALEARLDYLEGSKLK